MRNSLVGVVAFALRDPSRPLVVLGPSIGTSTTNLWGPVAERLVKNFDVLGWDLPGHGVASPPGRTDLVMADIAHAVATEVALAQEERGDAGTPWFSAGDSVGGCVTLQLMLDRPDEIAGGVAIASGAKVGTPQSWQERIDMVRGSGTSVLISQSAQRWFAPGFTERAPEETGELLNDLHHADDGGYVSVCHALGGFDVRPRLGDITRPVLAVAGAQDQVTPPASAQEIAEGVGQGRLEVIEDAAHLPPIEQPARIAELIADFVNQNMEADR